MRKMVMALGALATAICGADDATQAAAEQHAQIGVAAVQQEEVESSLAGCRRRRATDEQVQLAATEMDEQAVAACTGSVRRGGSRGGRRSRASDEQVSIQLAGCKDGRCNHRQLV